ncbi:hypothetical protein O7623_12015 [Solwaraspora sp. WMMD791]|uniref:hypothetical protein n=1 Tax=Solwaraspora sp. WMMD791 TaxID=3016086 RepID=UPI00249AD4E9|nr:hypothetical protein [Solwaraspora sp. WMMD791]WFE29854.1 hypothetical protein O7623_12015 [Solwaraspora sp. WMMD791]
MEAEIAGLVAAGASAIVGAMATDGWQVVKQRLARLFSRSQPQAYNAVLVDFEETRRDLLNAPTHERVRIASIHEGEWRARIRMLLVADQDAVREFRKVLEEIDSVSVGISADGATFSANAYDNGRVYQQGSGIQYNG